MRSALAQLAQDPENRLVFIDGKYGDGLGVVSHLPHLAGPMATDVESVKRALSWSVVEMKRRYQTGDKQGRIIVAVDEIQEFTGQSGDDAIVAMMRTLVSQGRGARVHVLAGTQNPTAKAFSDTDTQRNLVGRVALHAFNYKHSEALVGGPSPRADYLLGAGDGYTLTPGAIYRAQLAYVPEADLERLNGAEPEMPEWPEFDAEAAGTLAEDDSTGWQYSGPELGVALIQAHLGNGRPTLQRALDNAGLGRPGSGRAERLLGLGREAYQWLRENDWRLCEA
jgi:DNA segregation ATPase FtsK/SpoIIIE-like protein